MPSKAAPKKAKKTPKLVLGLSGSPRRGGNTDALVNEVLKGAKKAGARTRFINVASLKIRPCVACYYCAAHHGVCAIKDDMAKINDALAQADVWVFGSPVYWFNMSAQLKTVVDRLFPFAVDPCCSPLRGKTAAVVTTSGDPHARVMSAPIFDSFEQSFEFLGVKFAGRLAAQGVDKKDVARRWNNFKPARALGAKLAK